VPPRKPLPDVIAPGLDVLFCGINPSLTSAEVGHHFARPGNRFWATLHASGWTPRRLAPEEDGDLPALGVGVTNLASRPTRAAAEVTEAELRDGAVELDRVVREHEPRPVAIGGLTANRGAVDPPPAAGGAQNWPPPRRSSVRHNGPPWARSVAQETERFSFAPGAAINSCPPRRIQVRVRVGKSARSASSWA